jgi:sec-independent protein translocase protein TatB
MASRSVTVTGTLRAKYFGAPQTIEAKHLTTISRLWLRRALGTRRYLGKRCPQKPGENTPRGSRIDARSLSNDCRFSGSGSMMNRMSFSETIFLFFLALIIFGPKKLPEIARQVGKALNEFKRSSNEFKAQIEQEISNLEVENRQTILPPSPLPQGVTSRSLYAASGQVIPPEPPATLAALTDEPVASTQPPPVATEAVAPVASSNDLASPASQESHV